MSFMHFRHNHFCRGPSCVLMNTFSMLCLPWVQRRVNLCHELYTISLFPCSCQEISTWTDKLDQPVGHFSPPLHDAVWKSNIWPIHRHPVDFLAQFLTSAHRQKWIRASPHDIGPGTGKGPSSAMRSQPRSAHLIVFTCKKIWSITPQWP